VALQPRSAAAATATASAPPIEEAAAAALAPRRGATRDATRAATLASALVSLTLVASDAEAAVDSEDSGELRSSASKLAHEVDVVLAQLRIADEVATAREQLGVEAARLKMERARVEQEKLALARRLEAAAELRFRRGSRAPLAAASAQASPSAAAPQLPPPQLPPPSARSTPAPAPAAMAPRVVRVADDDERCGRVLPPKNVPKNVPNRHSVRVADDDEVAAAELRMLRGRASRSRSRSPRLKGLRHAKIPLSPSMLSREALAAQKQLQREHDAVAAMERKYASPQRVAVAGAGQERASASMSHAPAASATPAPAAATGASGVLAADAAAPLVDALSRSPAAVFKRAAAFIQREPAARGARGAASEAGEAFAPSVATQLQFYG
jgi:hypothetical protein